MSGLFDIGKPQGPSRRVPKKPIGFIDDGAGGYMDRGRVASGLSSGRPIGGGMQQLGAGDALIGTLNAVSGNGAKGFEFGAGAASKIPGYKPGQIAAIAPIPRRGRR